MKTFVITTTSIATICASVAIAAPRELVPCDDMEILRPQKLATENGDIDAVLQPITNSNPAKCDRGVRLDVGTAIVWRCRVILPQNGEIDENQWIQAIVIEAPANKVLSYRSDMMANAYDRFEVIKADLDADGAKENILATWDSQGNGMGVHSWTLRVFSANWRPISDAFEAKDWGPSAIVKSPNSNHCEIAITSWVDDNSRRVAGGALQANFVALNNGSIRPSTDLPILRRRFTFNFQKQRLETYENPIGNYEGDPIMWFSKTSYVYSTH